MKKVKNLLYIAAFITTVFYLSWRLVATIPWHDSWFALVFGLLLWLVNWFLRLLATFSF